MCRFSSFSHPWHFLCSICVVLCRLLLIPLIPSVSFCLQSLDVNDTSSLVELQRAMIALNRAHENELSELENFYSDKRNYLQTLIEVKTKKK